MAEIAAACAAKVTAMKTRKTWNEKLADSKDLPKVVRLAPNGRLHWGGETMVVPAPREVDELMRQVPRGKVVTIAELRAALARRHGTDIACPLTTGIFTWIAANAAEESAAGGAKRVTPWWRTLKSGGELNPKFPGGIARQRQLLEAEGHTIVQKGRCFLVGDFEKRLAWMAP